MIFYSTLLSFVIYIWRLMGKLPFFITNWQLGQEHLDQVGCGAPMAANDIIDINTSLFGSSLHLFLWVFACPKMIFQNNYSQNTQDEVGVVLQCFVTDRPSLGNISDLSNRGGPMDQQFWTIILTPKPCQAIEWEKNVTFHYSRHFHNCQRLEANGCWMLDINCRHIHQLTLSICISSSFSVSASCTCQTLREVICQDPNRGFRGTSGTIRLGKHIYTYHNHYGSLRLWCEFPLKVSKIIF